MINLQVDDLDGLLDRLIEEGVTVDPNAKATISESLAGSPIRKEIVSSFGSRSQVVDAERPRWSP